eukprot:160597-Rhodomonas_salina.2
MPVAIPGYPRVPGYPGNAIANGAGAATGPVTYRLPGLLVLLLVLLLVISSCGLLAAAFRKFELRQRDGCD